MGLRRFAAMTSVVAAFLVAGASMGAAAQSPSPAAAGGLADTSWLLGSVAGAPVVSGTNATLVFSGDAAGGFAGCNQFFGSYQTDGTSTLTFGDIATTRKMCDPATMTFEQSYLTALATVATYAETADALTLSDAKGTAVLVYSAGATASVEGPWVVTGYNNGAAQAALVSPATPETTPTMAFGPDGIVQGFGGCNQYSGGYGVNGTSITIGPLMSTMMACNDATNTAEQQFLTAMQAATTWAINGGTLELRDDAGAMQVEGTSAIGH